MRHRARLEHRTRTVTRCCRMFSSPVGPKSLLSPARKPRAEGPWAGALYTLVSFQGFQRMRIKAHLFYRGLLLCARCGSKFVQMDGFCPHMSFSCPKILSMADFRFFPRYMTYRGLSFPNVLIDRRWLPLRAVDLKGSILGQGNNPDTVGTGSHGGTLE